MNSVVIIGRLTRDPEIRYTQSGKAVSNMTLAVKRRFKKDEVDFLDCVSWEKTAELTAEYLRKGSQVGITGALKQERFEVEGQKRSKVVINIEQLDFIGSKEHKGSNEEVGEKEEVADEDSESFPF